MKTIEQAATNAYSIEVLSSGCNAGVTFGKEMFKQGVEFAQKLISVKDEIPPIKDETYQVLVKDSYGDYNVFDIEDYESEKEILEDFELNEVTHWRLISFL